MREYAVITLHHPANMDDSQTLVGLVDVLDAVQSDMPVVFSFIRRLPGTC